MDWKILYSSTQTPHRCPRLFQAQFSFCCLIYPLKTLGMRIAYFTSVAYYFYLQVLFLRSLQQSNNPVQLTSELKTSQIPSLANTMNSQSESICLVMTSGYAA